MVDDVHAAGGRIGPQIWHVGSVVNPMTDWVPDAEVESPSGFSGPGKPRGLAMSEEDVADTVAAFGRAAADARWAAKVRAGDSAGLKSFAPADMAVLS